MTFSVVPRDKQQVLALVETELGSYRRVLCPLWRLCSRCSQPHHPTRSSSQRLPRLRHKGR